MSHHRSTLYRRKLAESDPDKYEEMRKRRAEMERERRAKIKAKWENEPHTRAQMEQREADLKEKRARARQRYEANKAEKKRQTRSSSVMPNEERKMPKDMTPDEYRAYRTEQRRKQRMNLSHQKKAAIRSKRREIRKTEKEARLQQLATETPQSSTSTSKQMRQSLYNLNHEYKQKARQLGATNEEYAKAALNLVNPRTPQKKVAIMAEQRTHPCKALFQEPVTTEEHNMEKELGIQSTEILCSGPSQEDVSNTVHDKIQAFYSRWEVSRILPHSRYSTKHGPARVMVQTVKSSYELFCREEGKLVGLTTFQNLRPRNVRLMGSIPLESCLCVYCTNIRLKIQTMNRLIGSSGQIPAETDMLNFLTCLHDGKWPDIKCIDGLCTHCSDKMRPFEIFCRDLSKTDTIQWERWEKNTEGKMEPVSKTGNIRDLLDDLKKDISKPTSGCSFIQHLFTAYWQYSQFKKLRTNPEEGEIIMVQDFGENRKAAYCSEIKTAHFGKQQITVHPVVCFFRSGDAVVRESLIFLSDDTQHDYHAVRAFTNLSIEHLQKKVQIKKLIIWSDGCASQYKGRGTFHDLTLLPYSPQRCFYGSEHGKGEADGETGVMSQALKRANYQGINFRWAQDMVDYLTKHLGNERRHYILVKEIDRVDPEDEILTIPGTRSYHQFQTLRPYILQARRLACFCTACKEGLNSRCINAETVGTYTIHKCKPSIKTVMNEAFVENIPSPEEATPSTNSKRCPKVGDFVKLTCFVNKIQKIFYAGVIAVTSETQFSVHFLQKSGSVYVPPSREDEGLITPGPPDFYSWEVLEDSQWQMDHRQRYTFKV